MDVKKYVKLKKATASLERADENYWNKGLDFDIIKSIIDDLAEYQELANREEIKSVRKAIKNSKRPKSLSEKISKKQQKQAAFNIHCMIPGIVELAEKSSYSLKPVPLKNRESVIRLIKDYENLEKKFKKSSAKWPKVGSDYIRKEKFAPYVMNLKSIFEYLKMQTPYIEGEEEFFGMNWWLEQYSEDDYVNVSELEKNLFKAMSALTWKLKQDFKISATEISMLCEQCGAIMTKGAKFCGKCGSKLKFD
jgi:hypothetical protein